MQIRQNIRNAHAHESADLQSEVDSHLGWLNAAAKRGLVWPLLVAIAAIIVAPHMGVALQLKSVLWLSFGIVALSLDLVWEGRNLQLWPECPFWYRSIRLRGFRDKSLSADT